MIVEVLKKTPKLVKKQKKGVMEFAFFKQNMSQI
jgi:hypothetical protein